VIFVPFVASLVVREQFTTADSMQPITPLFSQTVLAEPWLSAQNALLAIWLLAMGGAIGSFLNVVVYRLPAGLSLIRPGSHCPACKHPIRWHDNLPVFGWLVLRGRCRDCRSPISTRYPLVEAISAMTFLALGVCELLLRGANLPLRPEIQRGDVFGPPLDTAQFAEMLAYHLFFFSTLLAAMLIEYDGQRIPVRLWLPAMAIGGLAPLAWPWLHPVPAALLPGDWIGGLADGVAGAGAGAILGWLTRPLVGRRYAAGFSLALVGTGLFLGWQAVVVLGVASVLMDGLWRGCHVLARKVGWDQFAPASAGPPFGVSSGGPAAAKAALSHPTLWLWMAAIGWVFAWSPLVASGIGRLWIGRPQ
jgi:prepilin signal peptidase PulO-like enzyme (type II secretory pathway)